MEITILGTGTSTPHLHRNASGLVVHASGLWVLVDIGPGTLRRMCEAAIDNKWIDLILITHFHPDHVSDLVPLLFASNYEFGAVRTEPFHVVGPQGLEQFYETLVATYGDWIVPTGGRLLKKEMNPREADAFSMKGVTIRSAPAAHTFPSLSYRIEANGVSVTVSGDTDVSVDLVELARHTDLLICECALPDHMKVPGHLVPSEAGKIAADAGARKLVLTHFYPPCDEVDVVVQAASAFSGEIVKAWDLMVIEI
ncbi:MAG: MBL fold metallo-hydrolase [Deltaproteobacteria bacterium]|nr:MBL fold metallo-hydrolase [Deltaproteobacteria bacterium]